MNQIPDKMIKVPPNYPETLAPGEVKRRFKALLGPFETAETALDIEILAEEVIGEVIRQKIAYNVADDERITAYHLYRPGLPNDAPGILSIHEHGANEVFPVGKDFHCRPDSNDPRQYSYIAAVNGFRVLAPDALCFGERRTPFGYAENFFDELNSYCELTGRGRSLAWKAIWDNSRAIEVLETLGASSIGVIGCSGGSTQAYMLAAVNPKVKATACYFSFLTLRHQFYQFRCCHCLYHFIPGMIAAGIDWDQVVALIAPRKLFLAWGAQDEGTPEPAYRAFRESFIRRCETENLPDSLTCCEEPERGHEITQRQLKAGLEFLKSHL